jgi:hypothetical protein
MIVHDPGDAVSEIDQGVGGFANGSGKVCNSLPGLFGLLAVRPQTA